MNLSTTEIIAAIQKQGRTLDNFISHLQYDYSSYFGECLNNMPATADNPEYLIFLGAFFALENALKFDKSIQFQQHDLVSDIPDEIQEILSLHFGHREKGGYFPPNTPQKL